MYGLEMSQTTEEILKEILEIEQAGNKIEEDAKAKAKKIIEEAKAQAEKLIKDTRKETEGMIEKLKEEESAKSKDQLAAIDQEFAKKKEELRAIQKAKGADAVKAAMEVLLNS